MTSPSRYAQNCTLGSGLEAVLPLFHELSHLLRVVGGSIVEDDVQVQLRVCFQQRAEEGYEALAVQLGGGGKPPAALGAVEDPEQVHALAPAAHLDQGLLAFLRPHQIDRGASLDARRIKKEIAVSGPRVLDAIPEVAEELLLHFRVSLGWRRSGPQERKALAMEDPHDGPDRDELSTLLLDVVPGVFSVPVRVLVTLLARRDEDRLLDLARFRGGQDPASSGTFFLRSPPTPSSLKVFTQLHTVSGSTSHKEAISSAFFIFIMMRIM